MKANFCIAYCYEIIIFRDAIVTDRAGVQPIGCRLGPRPRAQACGKQLCPAIICRLMVATLVIHVITHLPTPEGWKAEFAYRATMTS